MSIKAQTSAYAGDNARDEFSAGERFDPTVIPTAEEVDAAWCLRFLRSIRDVAFATVDADGLPGVRIIDVMMVSADRLYFLAPRGKAFHGDIMRKRYTAIVGQTPDYRTCRLRGRVERPTGEAEQRALVDRIFELNPSMNLIYPGDLRYICDVFYIAQGEGEYFDLGQRPIFRKSFSLGEGELKSGTFLITDTCTECAVCARACPEQCIMADSPFTIDQEHCLRCGICLERCPVQAIVKR